MLQQKGNLRENASVLKIPSPASQPTFLERALTRIRDLQLSEKLRAFLPSNAEEQNPPTKINRVLRWIFGLLVLLVSLPIILSSADVGFQNVILLFWALVIIFGAIGARRGFTRESIILMSAILGLALNHVLRRYFPAVYDLPETDLTYFWLRIMILEILIYLGYQASRSIFRRTSRIVTGNPVGDKVLGATLGAINGYLIAGAALFYYHVADYPYPNFLFKSGDPALLQKTNSLMIYLPPYLLGEPQIYFAVILAFLFVLIVLT